MSGDRALRAAASGSAGQGTGLPRDYLKHGYFQSPGVLWDALIVEHPRDIARALHAQGLSAGTLRRFFGMARRAEARLDLGRRQAEQPEETAKRWAEVRPLILELKPLAHDAWERKVAPELFRDFIDRNVEAAIENETAVRKGFLPHFQYVCAFFPRR